MRPLLILAGLLLAWAALVRLADVPPYLLVSPERALLSLWQQPWFYAGHAWVTFKAMILALIFGLSAGMAFGALLVWQPKLEPWFWPLLVASQAIPVFAIGPLLSLWLGFTIWMQTTMAALIIFFPITVSTRYSLRQAQPEFNRLAASMQARPWLKLRHITLPLAFQVFAPGLLVAVATAPIGVVVGEWIGSSAGLGHLMIWANNNTKLDVMFAALFLLCLMGYGSFALTQALVRRWGWWFYHD